MIEERVQQYTKQLDALGMQYEVVEHPDLRKVEDVSTFLHIPINDCAHTLIMQADGKFISVTLLSDSKLDIEKFKKEFGINKLRMATEDEFTSITKAPVGAAQVYVEVIEKSYVDKRVLEKEYVYGGTGSFFATIKYKSEDLKKMPHVVLAEVSALTKGKRVYSGMRATGTGRLHLGNYLGGAKGMLALQDEYDCIFSVVDAHAVTTPYDPKTLKDQVRNVILDYLAVGLDPEKCKLEIQSQIPEHTELAYYLSSVYPLAPLEDLPTFKDKKAQYPKHVTVALLNYPILMAADILLYKGELVPVGIDQEPHLEVAREVVRRFNALYGETFPEPIRFKTNGEYVPSLLGTGKMSKTVEGSSIYLADDLETIKKKLAKVPTDSGTTGGEVPKEGGVASLFTLLALFNRDDMHKKFKHDYEDGKIRYGEMKNFLTEAIYKELQPIQEKRKYFEDHPEVVDALLEKSRLGCQKIAQATMREVKEKMGLPL
ncbi:MAG: tryptophan--tRNA ligase [Candidatus Levyibacteriota bacterium]